MIACGDAFTLVLCESGLIYSWGAGEEGQLGNGKKQDSEIP